MDPKLIPSITRALDISLATVAEQRFNNLTERMTSQYVAQQVLRSLRSFEDLQKGIMPKYNIWDSVFYSLWYQPGHINLAYTLVKKVPRRYNPLVSGSGSLFVRDFGCGELAMQFGVALAALDSFEEHGTVPEIIVFSEDNSPHMISLGNRTWSAFLREISGEGYPDLAPLYRICRNIRIVDQFHSSDSTWLSALHVAYEENRPEVHKELGERVNAMQPDVVIVTSHPRSYQHIFSPAKFGYKEDYTSFAGAIFSLEGHFDTITSARYRIFQSIRNGLNYLPDDDSRFVRNYLTRHKTSWWPSKAMGTRDYLHLKRSIGNECELSF